MASLEEKLHIVRGATSSISNCTSITPTILGELLLPKDDQQSAHTRQRPKSAASSRTNSRAAPVHSKTKKVTVDIHECEKQLSTKERSILATEVINKTLNSLSEAIKSSGALEPVRRQASEDVVKTSATGMLRRSNSLLQSPSQPRSLNRLATSPSVSSRESRSSSTSSTTICGHRLTAECARIAFACLRALQASKLHRSDFAGLQLENGMSVLVGKLISMGMDDLALKELWILKRRLGAEGTAKKEPRSKTGTTATAQSLADFLDFGDAKFSGEKLELVITTQIQILRLMTCAKNPKQVECALPILRETHSSSPTRLLLVAAQNTQGPRQVQKLSRQLHTLSEILLSLCPSISLSDDGLAVEGRLSIGPEVAIQLQSIALHNRFLWWGLAGHQGDISKDILDPFLRCLSTFARRARTPAQNIYSIATEAFKDLKTLLVECSPSTPKCLSAVVASINKLMGSLANDAGLIQDAIGWTEKFYHVLKAGNGSDIRITCALARLITFKLKLSGRNLIEEELLLKLLDDLERPFKGAASEIDDLLLQVSLVRRGATQLLADYGKSSEQFSGVKLSPGFRKMCESLVFLCPRLSLRYLGSLPDPNSTTKEIVRHEQRKIFITKPSIHAVDSALFLIRTLLSEGRLEWDLVDSRLQDCTLLLGRLDLESREASIPADLIPPSPSYHVRISNLYYTQYLSMKKAIDNPKDLRQLRALRRSIDSVLRRSRHEKKVAQVTAKLERLAEFCRDTARYDELLETLFTLRDELIGDGVLATVVEGISCQPLKAAWSASKETTALGRTIQSLLKVQLKYIKPKGHISLFDVSWSEEERAAILEQELEYVCGQSQESDLILELQSRAFVELLRIYTLSKYPLRRARTILRLWSTNYEKLNTSLREILAGFDPDQIEVLDMRGTADGDLAACVPHYKTLFTMKKEFEESEPQVEIFRQGLKSWSSIASQSQDVTDFQAKIDDVPGLVTFLHSVADWLQIQGFENIRVAALRLIAEITELCDTVFSPDDLVLSFTRLGAQWLHLGYSGKAGRILEKAKTYHNKEGVSSYAKLQLHICFCDYLLAIGSLGKVEDNLECAQAIYAQHIECEPKSKSIAMLEQRTKMDVLISNTYNLYSKLALACGAGDAALSHAKQSIRLLRRSWATIEDHTGRNRGIVEAGVATETDKLVGELSELTLISSTGSSTVDLGDLPVETDLWTVIMPLFHSLNHLSAVYAHHGIFQETVYYAEQALKLASQVKSSSHMAVATSMLGSIWLKGGNLEKGSGLIVGAKKSRLPSEKDVAVLASNLGIMHGLLGDYEAELTAYGEADVVLGYITQEEYIGKLDQLVDSTDALDEKISQLTIGKVKKPGPRRNPARSRAGAGRQMGAKTVAVECRQLSGLRASVLRSKARAILPRKRFSEALELLQEAENLTESQTDFVDQRLAMAKQLLLHSLEQMNADPVYSVLQDSTISFPSVVGIPKSDKNGDRHPVTKTSPKKGASVKVNTDRAHSRSSVHNSFFDKLRQAQEQSKEAYSLALVSPVAVVHKVSNLLNCISILLSTAYQSKGKSPAHPGLSSLTVETARNIAIRRERKAIQTDLPRLCRRIDESCWPQFKTSDSQTSNLGFHDDSMLRFQREYIDIIPKPWTVISMSLSESRLELSITKLQAGHSPFILMLPLGRNNSIDADEEVFGYEQGRTEFQEIIQLANQSAHDACNRVGREAKISWWEEREALDSRMRDLLQNIEKVWLGGFTGIFFQHARRPELFTRFQKSFENILDKHLPSRQKTKKRDAGPRVYLDSRILELFIGLGDASDEECDFADPLTDLLYFVVDILQFHGELNAYAEIDFDVIVVETTDALRCYHEAVHASGQVDEGQHTILILDKALNMFPWESLPCLDGLAVSRLPSLVSLRDRLINLKKEEKKETEKEEKEEDFRRDGMLDGHYIRRDYGSYILNPGGDLKHTQATFEKTLQGLAGWNGIINRAPTEEEMKGCLQQADLLLYFGHGSGAQYIRAREIKRMEKCAVTILMGCSSGALVETGEFEAYGPPTNYMHAGCHALVATLWDVTDKDIDRFAKSAFENWGLFAPEPVTKVHRPKKKEVAREEVPSTVSLVEAVARGRHACTLKYLNAAAVCVYGVPVYFRR